MKKIILLLLVLLIPSAYSLDVSDLEFLEFESHGETIGAVSKGRIPNIDMKIVVTGENFERLEADISGLNRNAAIVAAYGYENKIVSADECEKEGDTYTCYIRRIILLLSDATVALPITLYNSTGSVALEEAYTFEIDDTKPVVDYMGSERCIGEDCYIGSDRFSRIRIDFSDSKATFQKRLIRFSLNGKLHFVQVCEGMTCYGNAKTTCNSGQEVALRIVPDQTMDDAYNRVSNSYSTELICDNQEPEIISAEVISTTTLDIVKTGDTADIVIEINEDNPGAEIVVNVSELGEDDLLTGQCLSVDDFWRCKVTASVTLEGPFEAAIPVTIIDIGGNEVTTTIAKTIYGLDDDLEPDNWYVQGVLQSPTVINKANIAFLPRKIFARVDLRSRGGNIDIVDFRNNINCNPADEGLGHDIVNVDILNDYPGNSDLFITADLKQGEYRNITTARYNCSFEILSRRGGYVTTTYEKENFFLKIRFNQEASMSQHIQDEITESVERTESLRKKVESIRRTTGFAISVCNTFIGIKGVSGALGSAEVATAPLTAIGLGAIPQGLGTASTATSGIVDIAGISSSILPICEFMTCRSAVQRQIMEKASTFGLDLPGLDIMAKAGGYSDFSQVLDPCNNIVMSVAGMCLPGFINNLERLNSINCEYSACLSRDVLELGLPVSACQEARGFAKCKYIWGTVFGTVPYTAAARAIGQSAKKILSDPVTFLSTAGIGVLCGVPLPFSEAVHGLCTFAASVSAIPQLYNMVSQMKLPSFGEETTTYCEQVNNAIDHDTGYWLGMPNEPDFIPYQWNVDLAGFEEDAVCTIDAGCRFPTSTAARAGLGDISIRVNSRAGRVEGVNIPPGQIQFYKNGVFLGSAENLQDAESNWRAGRETIPAFQEEVTEPAEVQANEIPSWDNLVSEGPSTTSSTLTPSSEEGTREPPRQYLDSEEILLELGVLQVTPSGELRWNGNRWRQLQDQTIKSDRAATDLANRVLLESHPDVRIAFEAYIDAETALMKDRGDYIVKIAKRDNQILQLRTYQARAEDLRRFDNSDDGKRNRALGDKLVSRDGLTDKEEDDYSALQLRRERLHTQVDIEYRNYADSLKGDPEGDPPIRDETPVPETDLRNDEDLMKDEIKRLEDKRDIDDGKLEKLENDRLSTRNKFLREDIFFKAWRSGAAQTIASTWAFGRTMSLIGPGLSNLIDSEFAASWRARFQEIFSSDVAQGLFSQEDLLCEQTAQSSASAPLVKTGVVSFAPAAHIQGFKSELFDFNDITYEYFISGAVSPGKKEGLSFKILLYKSGKSGEFDITPDDSGLITLGTGPEIFSREDMITLNSSQDYSEVCIKFMGGNIYQYFDEVSALDGQNRLCQRIVIG